MTNTTGRYLSFEPLNEAAIEADRNPQPVAPFDSNDPAFVAASAEVLRAAAAYGKKVKEAYEDAAYTCRD